MQLRVLLLSAMLVLAAACSRTQAAIGPAVVASQDAGPDGVQRVDGRSDPAGEPEVASSLDAEVPLHDGSGPAERGARSGEVDAAVRIPSVPVGPDDDDVVSESPSPPVGQSCVFSRNADCISCKWDRCSEAWEALSESPCDVAQDCVSTYCLCDRQPPCEADDLCLCIDSCSVPNDAVCSIRWEAYIACIGDECGGECEP